MSEKGSAITELLLALQILIIFFVGLVGVHKSLERRFYEIVEYRNKQIQKLKRPQNTLAKPYLDRLTSTPLFLPDNATPTTKGPR